MILPRVFASSLALAASSLRARPAVACAAAKHTLPSSVLDQQGAALSEAATTQQLGGKRVALYFSAGWCPMCTSFEPSLQQFLQASEDSGKPCSLIYVPSDRTEAEALRRAKGLGLLSVPFEEAGVVTPTLEGPAIESVLAEGTENEDEVAALQSLLLMMMLMIMAPWISL